MSFKMYFHFLAASNGNASFGYPNSPQQSTVLSQGEKAFFSCVYNVLVVKII